MKEPYPDQVNHIELGKGPTFIVAQLLLIPSQKLAHGLLTTW